MKNVLGLFKNHLYVDWEILCACVVKILCSVRITFVTYDLRLSKTTLNNVRSVSLDALSDIVRKIYLIKRF